MQAITISIGKKGVEYFANTLVAQKALEQLSKMVPPDQIYPDLPKIRNGDYTYTDINVLLTEGKLVNCDFRFDGVDQKKEGDPAGNLFHLRFATEHAFSAAYNWFEKYHWRSVTVVGGMSVSQSGDKEKNLDYTPEFSSLAIEVDMTFDYDEAKNNYEVGVSDLQSQVAVKNPNIPKESILQRQPSCFSSAAKDATAAMIANINFESALQAIFPPVFREIPASGKLTQNIRYDFAVGSSGMQFTVNNQQRGLQIGATGKVQFKDELYDGEEAPDLPLPPVPLDEDQHQLNIYVSQYEVNGLYWAYFMDGGLNVTVTPNDLSSPGPLKTDTYKQAIPALKPYGKSAMHAHIKPLAAPVNSFQEVYIFDDDAMARLKSPESKLPDDERLRVDGLAGDAYVSEQALTDALTDQGINSDYFETIVKAVRQKGMVATQEMDFIMVIQYPEEPKPQIAFTMKREDVMTDLHLGKTLDGTAQTMQFDFANASNEVKYDPSRTTVPNFTEAWWGPMIWPLVGEPNYALAMSELGSTGVPIPIMKDFKFLFDKAILRIEEGYISILADVEYKPASA